MVIRKLEGARLQIVLPYREMIQAIIFDYYGVLTTDRYVTWLKRNEAALQGHADEIEALSQQQDLGLGADEFYARLGALVGRPADEVRDEFGIRQEAHHGLVDYIRHLRKVGYKTAILSNSPRSLYAETQKHGLNSLFDIILCSEEAGVTKPNPKMYELMLQRLGITAEEAVFVDDRDYNVAGANAVGLTGVLYTGLAELEAEFERRGLHAPR